MSHSSMALRDIAYADDYRSGPGKLVDEFFRPSLTQANRYWRAVGYFSSSALERFGAPLGEFLKHDGHIRLITSVELHPGDLEVIARGQKAKSQVCSERLEAIIDEEFAEGVGPGVDRLARLLELRRLEILIATPRHGTGIYHEKIGIFFDETDYVAFSGSANESRHAFEENRECIDVFPSWSDGRRAARKLKHFQDLWGRVDPGVEIYTFPEAAQRKLIRKCEEHRAGDSSNPNQVDPNSKWQHQELATKTFLEEERGILNMATGTGKTRTALKIVRRLVADNKIDTVIVTTDGNDLLRQWRSELLGLRRDVKFQLFSDFDNYREVQSFNLAPEKSILLVARLSREQRAPLASALKSLTRDQQGRTLLIHDEVHKLGSPSNRERLTGLSDQIRYRLGLSATPEREYDEDGNSFIEEHIGKNIIQFPLENAISRGILAPFDYYPLSYKLTTNDRERLRDVYRKKAAREAEGNLMSDQELWTDLARVYKTSEGKLPVFRSFISTRKELLKRCIIFVETQEYAESVLEIVHQHRADFHTYFSGEASETLRRFARGELECLVTCHRVSEGIDIRSLASVILFSSARAQLETIQRMGRCLRTDPENPNKVANVVDFVRHSDESAGEPNADELRCDWLTTLSKIRRDEADI